MHAFKKQCVALTISAGLQLISLLRDTEHTQKGDELSKRGQKMLHAF